jgi:hypothetical protein
MRVEKCAKLLLRRILLEVADVKLDTRRLVLRPLLARGAAELVVVLDRAELRVLEGEGAGGGGEGRRGRGGGASRVRPALA